MTVYEVQPVTRPISATVTVPGSKSQTNRALLLAALATGTSHLGGALFSDDTRVMLDSLARLGFAVRADEQAATIEVSGAGGAIPSREAELYVGNAGTAARFLTAFLTLGAGVYLLDGASRMRERPIGELLDALRALGADVEAVRGNGCPPVRVQAAGLDGGEAVVDASRSGQFLSALLMIGAYTQRGVRLTVAGHLASPPYIDMTLRMMQEWGVEAVRETPPPADRDGAETRVETDAPGGASYVVPGGQRYVARVYDVPPDASGASYFLAAAAITGGTVRVRHLTLAQEQGDLEFVGVLERMGCSVVQEGDDIILSGPQTLRGIDLDMNGISDMSITLAAIAPFASGPVTIRNVAHIRHQETDRVAAMVAELRRLGARVEERADGLTIFPSPLRGATVYTYDDHRMAMAFAITGLRVAGVAIENPACVAKTFPDYFPRLEAATR
jgi:3-phosphoshikimate 1-carboxyvinyltransferase